ncbi:TPA: hypothetical protein ACH3X1_014793 [Trebouxia sp. C0004]
MCEIWLAGTGQGGWQAVVEVHPAAAVSPGPQGLHTNARVEHSSSAGQRALQVGDDSKWVVIASSGLQRAAANLGAGGMLPACWNNIEIDLLS